MAKKQTQIEEVEQPARKKNPTIVLDENYRIEVEAACWTLMYEKEGPINPVTGKPSISRGAPSFHITLPQALKDYVNQSLKESGSIDEVIEKIAELDAKIDKLFKGIKRNGIV